jgi:DNA-binding NtrC family response regulator
MEADFPVVLVVDDDENILYAISYLLERKGCKVLSALTPQAALAAVKDVEPHAAVIDIILPGMNGLKLVGVIKARWPSCEMVIITGQSSVETVVESIHQGAVDYLFKPFESIEEVWKAVQRALQRREAPLTERVRAHRT